MLDTRALRLGVVHLKSRGGCKGQQTPCWEQARLKAIDALITQLSQQTEPGLPTIIAGDFNTLPNEKPLRKLGEAGFTPMLKTPQAYSYRYRGKPLLLDHAFLRVPNDRPHALTPIKYAKKYSEKISTHVIKLSSDEAPFLHPTHRDHDLFQQLHSALNNSALNESELNQIALTKSTTVGPFRFSDHDPLVIDVPLNTFEHND
jgi:predicted extracellular nuclease